MKKITAILLAIALLPSLTTTMTAHTYVCQGGCGEYIDWERTCEQCGWTAPIPEYCPGLCGQLGWCQCNWWCEDCKLFYCDPATGICNSWICLPYVEPPYSTLKALRILKHIVKLEILTVEQQQELICCGGEKTVTTADALCVLKKVVGIGCGKTE